MGTGLGNADWLALVESYGSALGSETLAGFRKRRWLRSQEFADWLGAAELLSLSMDQALCLYRAAGGRRSKEFNSNSIEDIRDSLDFLLHDTVKLEGRFDECASEAGGYYLAGAGKEFVSYLLCLRAPSLCAVWNPSSESALRRLGVFPKTMKKGPIGIQYLDLMEAFERLRSRAGLKDFQQVDEVCYLLSRKQLAVTDLPVNS